MGGRQAARDRDRTETGDADAPHLLVPVATTPACVAEAAALAPIHEQLADRHRLPSRPLVDAGDLEAEVLAASQARDGVEMRGPTRGNGRGPARAPTGFAGPHFAVDWETQRVIGPQGHASRSGAPMQDRRQGPARNLITVAFSARECRPCPRRARCTRSAHRGLTLPPREQEQA